MNYIPKSVTNVTSLIGWSKEYNDNNLTTNKEILKIASVLNSSHIENGLVDLPKLVVVGTQSSGKSSLLNALIGMEILPVGKSMTTRTPLHLDLIPTTNESRVEFGEYVNCVWQISKRINITYPNITAEQRESIKTDIEIYTAANAGNGLNISNNPIYLKVYANNIPNLSLVDLPGLTSVAITDRGQPKDIKEQIINLTRSYIDNENAIILAIMAARPDIEADMAMEIVKQADVNGNRTVGILTKLDLMNEENDISNYLDNNVSNDLKLHYGYFGIKNKSSPAHSIADAIQNERTYFLNHPVYRHDKYSSRLGIPNLCHTLSNVLIYNIKLSLPNVLLNIIKKLEEITKELEALGTSIPPDPETRINAVNRLLNTYIKNFSQAIEHRGSTIQTGRQLKECFTRYRHQIAQLDPFVNYDKEYIVDVLKSYDGIHMSFPYLPMEILENTLRDARVRPIMKLLDPSIECLNQSLELLTELNQTILETTNIKKYPNLVKAIRTVIINDIFVTNHVRTRDRIIELISQEEAYIWTDSPEFVELLNSDFSKIIKPGNTPDIDRFRLILSKYFLTIVRNVRENIPKAIVYSMINSSIESLGKGLYERILSCYKQTYNSTSYLATIGYGSNTAETANNIGVLNSLLEENPEVENRRRYLEKSRIELCETKKLIESIL